MKDGVPVRAWLRGWKPRLGSADESAVSWQFRLQRVSRAAASSRRIPAASLRHPIRAATVRCVSRDRGFTLLEFLVTLAILGVSVGVVGVSMAVLEPRAEAEVPRRIAEARATAIRTGAPVTVELDSAARVTLFPNGSATPARIRDDGTTWRMDPWTGEVRRER